MGFKETDAQILFVTLVIIYFLLLFAGVGAVEATDYYVATWGNNSSSGNFTHPWQNISYAAQQAVAGDTIYLFDGVWYDEHVVFANSGNDTHPITLTAYNGTPTMDGGDSSVSVGSVLGGYEFINISGIAIRNTTKYEAILVRRSNNIHLKDMTISNTSDIGISFSESTNCSIIDSTIHNTGWNSVMTAGSEDYSTKDIIIKNCTIYNSPNHGLIDIHRYSYGYIEISNNTIYYTPNVAIYIHTGTNRTGGLVIKNNIIHDAWKGIQTEHLWNDIVYTNNTIYNCDERAVLAKGNNVTWKRNLFYNNTAGVQMVGDNITFDDNQVSNYYRIDEGNGTIRNEKNDSFVLQTGYGGNGKIEYADGRIFETVVTWHNGNYTVISPRYWPEKSNYSIVTEGVGEGGVLVSVTVYNMTAVPASDYATVTVNKFNTSLPQGNILVNFTANTTDGNNVVFTVWGLKPNYHYLIKRNDVDYMTEEANSSGYIQFSNSEWSDETFTIEESSTPPSLGNISGTVTTLSFSPIQNATITIVGTGRSADTDGNGNYTIEDVPTGNYTITCTADGYEACSKQVAIVEGDNTVNFELSQVEDSTPPTTTYTISPTPAESGWNNVTPVVVTFFRGDGGSGISYTNYSKISATGPWTTINLTAATGTDAGNVTDVGESKFNITVMDEGVTTLWYYSVDNNSNFETVRNVTIKIDTASCETYDTNGTPGIQKDEVSQAIEDYLGGLISKETAVAVIICYYGLGD